MKKIILTVSCAFALTSCSEDAFQGIDGQNTEPDTQYSTNSFNDNNSGTLNPDGTKYPGENYASPWDIWFNKGFIDQQPAYIIANGNVEDLSPYKLEVWAYAGLAYFDGTNNGTYLDPKINAQFPINNGNYPKLFANGKEVGNLVRTAVPLTFNPQEATRMEDRFFHLRMQGGNNKYPQNTQLLDFGNQLTTQEHTLLRDYGKVFFYEVNVFEASNNAFVGKYILHPEIETLTNGSGPYWNPVNDLLGTQLKGFVQPLGGNFDLYYYENPNIPRTTWIPGDNIQSKCDSYEVVFRIPTPLHTHTILGSVQKTLSLRVSQNPFTFWQNSSLDLVMSK